MLNAFDKPDNSAADTASSKPAADGLFITFEGTEGVGKSTQVKLLTDNLRHRGLPVVTTREPGGTPLGEELRGLLKRPSSRAAPCPPAELLMMAACRAQLMREVVRPALQKRQVVIVDRFLDSTTAYQGYGRGLDLEFIQQLHNFTLENTRPDLTFLLDLDIAIGTQRSRERGGNTLSEDRFDNEEDIFHRKVRNGFLTLARQEPQRIKIVDASLAPEEVQELILEQVIKTHKQKQPA